MPEKPLQIMKTLAVVIQNRCAQVTNGMKPERFYTGFLTQPSHEMAPNLKRLTIILQTKALFIQAIYDLFFDHRKQINLFNLPPFFKLRAGQKL
jgi:hypothetical protein